MGGEDGKRKLLIAFRVPGCQRRRPKYHVDAKDSGEREGRVWLASKAGRSERVEGRVPEGTGTGHGTNEQTAQATTETGYARHVGTFAGASTRPNDSNAETLRNTGRDM